MFKKNNDENLESKNSQGTENGQKRKPLIERLGLMEPIEKEPKLPTKIAKEIIGEEIDYAVEAANSLGLSNLSREEIEEVDEDPEEAYVEVVTVLENPLDTMEEIPKEENPAVEEKKEITYDIKRPVREIYEEFGIDTGDIGTVYMVENFINALPATLPQEVRRQSLKALIQASHLDMRTLLKDGDERLKVLADYKGAFEGAIANSIAENERYIARLNEEIAKHRAIIESKLALKEAQHFEIEFEVQRLMNIVGFVKIEK